MGKPKLEDYKTATAWLKAMDKHKAVKSNTSSTPKAKRKKSASSSQGVLETDYGFGKYVPKKHLTRAEQREDYEKHVKKQHLGPLTKQVAKDDVRYQAHLAKIPGATFVRTDTTRGTRSDELTKRIERDAARTSKLGKPASETRTRYYEELNKERTKGSDPWSGVSYNMSPVPEGELPKKYIPKKKKKAKGGYVKKYAKGSGVRKAR